MITIINPQRRKKIKLDSYAGEWVAFVGDKIVAHNKNLKDLMKEIDAKGLRKKASILLVPRKDEGPYVLVIL
jgi:dihydroxyacetone kinase-like predicted kinase